MVAVVNYAQLLMVDGWRIFLVIALSTLMVLGATAWVVDKVYRYEVGRLKMSDAVLSILCSVATLVLYYANKNCIAVFINSSDAAGVHADPAGADSGGRPYLLSELYGETHWLLWLLGPATIAFAVPVYENVAVIKRHWMSLSAGVVTAVVVAVTSSVWLARGFMLSDEIQRSGGALGDHALALAAAKPLGGQPDLVALFVVITGVFGMAVEICCFYVLLSGKGWRKEPGSARLPMVRERRARMSWASRRAWWPAR